MRNPNLIVELTEIDKFQIRITQKNKKQIKRSAINEHFDNVLKIE